MESWRQVWRTGIALLLSQDQLEALRQALEKDDPRLIQGATTAPRPMRCVPDWPVEGACALGYCGWHSDGLVTVAEVKAYFVRFCESVDRLLGEPHACRFFISWFDDTPREQMRHELLREVQRELIRRLRQTAQCRPLAG